jgi:hypothetical protein
MKTADHASWRAPIRDIKGRTLVIPRCGITQSTLERERMKHQTIFEYYITVYSIVYVHMYKR